jgi:hypothetical protein
MRSPEGGMRDFWESKVFDADGNIIDGEDWRARPVVFCLCDASGRALCVGHEEDLYDWSKVCAVAKEIRRLPVLTQAVLFQHAKRLMLIGNEYGKAIDAALKNSAGGADSSTSSASPANSA